MTDAAETSPQNIDIEAAVLGCVLIAPEVFDELQAMLVAGDFYLHKHQWIWMAYCSLAEKGLSLDYLVVCEELAQMGKLDEVGGPAFVTGLINVPETSLNAVSYAKIVKDLSRRRHVIRTSKIVANAALFGGDPAEQITELSQFAGLESRLAVITQPMPTLDMPELPEAAQLDPDLGADACQWLDDYIEFSRRWSPRAYDGFHEAVALFVLSTVASRRVTFDLGKPRYTNLYFALAARTSLFAKSTTTEIGLQTLDRAGLYSLLAADSATPQKFLSDMSPHAPKDYNELDEIARESADLKLAFAGQRGWYYDEFGRHIAAMMNDAGFMADFRGLLRWIDDTPPRYEYGTISRGSERIDRPYLALIANLTPDDLRPFAKRGAALWGDGFLARFALITPPEGESKRNKFPREERIIPTGIIKPLSEWHRRLGVPEIKVKSGLVDGSLDVEIAPTKPEKLDLSDAVYNAFYLYHDSLLDLLEHAPQHDLDGNYTRLAEKALRVAALLASMSGAQAIGLNHWARAQTIAERWRAGLHELYQQINEPGPSEERKREEQLLQVIQRHGPATAADAARYVRNLSSTEAGRLLDGMVITGLLVADTTRRNTRRYGFPKE